MEKKNTLILRNRPTSHHAYLGCIQRACKTNETLFENSKEMFESRISAGPIEKLPGWKKPQVKTRILSLCYGRTRQKVRGRVLWAGKQESWTLTQSFKPLFGWSPNQEKWTWISWRIIWRVLTDCLAMFVCEQDILWSVNNFARSVTKYTQACDRRLARLISYIHHASDYLQKCHVDSTAQHCRLGLFQDSDFAEDLEHSKSISGGVWVFLVLAHLCLLAGCAKNKHQNHTVLPHPKFYRWMLGFEWAVFPALDLCYVVLDVLRSTHGDANSNVANSRETGARPTIRPKPKQTKTTRNISKWLWKEGRSPTMRQRNFSSRHRSFLGPGSETKMERNAHYLDVSLSCTCLNTVKR